MLLKNYNELKEKNKNLMSDYAILRSQLEELKTVSTDI
jgi:FtsZ-binding cell division protein ZapB